MEPPSSISVGPFLSVLIFTLDGQRYALRLSAVERVVRAAEVTALPNAPEVVLGVLDVGGEILPVFSLRRRFQLAEREVTLRDQFLIAHTTGRTVALVVDEAHGILEIPSERVTGATGVVPGLEHIQGVAAMEDGLVLIHDLETFLSVDEAAALDLAMKRKERHEH